MAASEVDRALLAQDAFAAFRRLDGERQQVMPLAAQMMADKCFPLTLRDIHLARTGLDLRLRRLPAVALSTAG